MSLDIGGRHKEVFLRCPLPNVLVPIVIVYLGNELVVQKRTRITRKSAIINIIDDDIYYQEDGCLYINDTNTLFRLGNLNSISKISSNRLLIQCSALNHVVCDIQTKKIHFLDAIDPVAFKGNVYYRSWSNRLYKLNETLFTILMSEGVRNINVQAGCMIASLPSKWICASDEKWYAAREETLTVHIYNGVPHYVHRDMLISNSFQYALDDTVLFAQQCGHCVYVSTVRSSYVWDLAHEKVYELNERIHVQETGYHRFARVCDEWVDHFF